MGSIFRGPAICKGVYTFICCLCRWSQFFFPFLLGCEGLRGMIPACTDCSILASGVHFFERSREAIQI